MLEVMEMVYQPRFWMCIKARMAHRPRARGERGLEVEESRVRRLADSSRRDRHHQRIRRLRNRRRRFRDDGGNNLACSCLVSCLVFSVCQSLITRVENSK